ncbi:spore coat U domain-containing protein [Enterobacteriaceae bacterium G50]|nr:spore coat U domain-containing protein [Enterobacteriaceae bacterium G50]
MLMRIFISIVHALFLFAIMTIHATVLAASGAISCEFSGGNSFSFGSLSIGSTATTTASAKYTCHLQDYTPGVNHYANICLGSEDAPPFKMQSNGDSEGHVYTLLFRAYNLSDPSEELQQHDNLMQQTIMLNTENTTVSGTFNLMGVVPAGQNDIPAYAYYNYSMTMRIFWNSEISTDALASCQSGQAQNSVTNGGNMQSSASVSDSCAIQSVTNLDFGLLEASILRQQTTRASAQIQARCPLGTAFSLGIDNGSHANGDSRQLCNGDNRCLTYTLWQDSNASTPWGNTANVDRMDVSSASGAAQLFSVYGEIPSGQSVNGDGIFSDDVVITLTY